MAEVKIDPKHKAHELHGTGPKAAENTGSMDVPSRDFLSEFGPDKKDINQFVGRTPMRGK